MISVEEKQYLMPGIRLHTSFAEGLKKQVVSTLDFFSALTPNLSKLIFNNEKETGEAIRINCKRSIMALDRCIDLEKLFKVVSIDVDVTKVLRGADKKTITAPLIWRTKLPAPAYVEVKGYDSTLGSYRLVSKTPSPTPQAIEALAQHGEKFDRTELWWVPKDILITKIPDPDPILVGVIETGCGEPMYFELHRWVDSTVEDAWWVKEGY